MHPDLRFQVTLNMTEYFILEHFYSQIHDYGASVMDELRKIV
jgi:hypothetical protein